MNMFAGSRGGAVNCGTSARSDPPLKSKPGIGVRMAPREVTVTPICVVSVEIIIIIYNPHNAVHLRRARKEKALKGNDCSLFTMAPLDHSPLQTRVKAAVKEAEAFLKSAFIAVHR